MARRALWGVHWGIGIGEPGNRGGGVQRTRPADRFDRFPWIATEWERARPWR